jgi:uncharacterized protein (UPF0179 family)
MSKFEAIQKKLAEAFSNFEAVSQIELNPSPEICITDYKGQSYIIVNIQLSESQCSILDRKIEKTIDFDKAKIFKIINAQTLGFIPIDGKSGLLGFGDSHCDFIFFDNQDFCFVEFKLNATSDKKINKKRKEAVYQLGNTINLFDQQLDNDYKQLNLKAYVCSPDFYPRNDAAWESFVNDFLENYGIDLFETREKICQEVTEE